MTESDMIRVTPEPLREMAAEILRRVDLPDADARLVAECLVQVDLWGVTTHGTRALKKYVMEFRTGGFNPRPTLRVVRETPTSAVLDGGGGIGYMTATRATEMLVDKAGAQGLAIVGTRRHGHVGCAGLYARKALRHDLITLSVAGWTDWQPPDLPDATVWDAVASPPLCIGIPSEDGPPLVVDICANLFLHSGGKFRQPEQLAVAMRDYPEPLIKSLGLKFAATLLGGILAGTVPPEERTDAFPTARRGYIIVGFHPDTVGNAEDFKGEVTRIIAGTRSLRPLPGKDTAELPGSLEWERERAWSRDGIPLAPEHRELLEAIAEDLGVPVPW